MSQLSHSEIVIFITDNKFLPTFFISGLSWIAAGYNLENISPSGPGSGNCFIKNIFQGCEALGANKRVVYQYEWIEEDERNLVCLLPTGGCQLKISWCLGFVEHLLSIRPLVLVEREMEPGLGVRLTDIFNKYPAGHRHTQIIYKDPILRHDTQHFTPPSTRLSGNREMWGISSIRKFWSQVLMSKSKLDTFRHWDINFS